MKEAVLKDVVDIIQSKKDRSAAMKATLDYLRDLKTHGMKEAVLKDVVDIIQSKKNRSHVIKAVLDYLRELKKQRDRTDTEVEG
jgi:hypothetical protein